MHYILMKKGPKDGVIVDGDVKAHLERIIGILGLYDIRIRMFLQADDTSRFVGLPELRVEDRLEEVGKQLDRIGYYLEGPFTTKKDAFDFWTTGNKGLEGAIEAAQETK